MAETSKKVTGHLTPLGDGRTWDPEPNERTYYRSQGSADRGWLVRRDGIDCIRLDRPMQDISRPYKAHEWLPEKEQHPLAPIAKAKIAFALDHELCQAIGLIKNSRKGWLDLTDDKKVEFMERGPAAGPDIRLKMYALVMEGLKEL